MKVIEIRELKVLEKRGFIKKYFLRPLRNVEFFKKYIFKALEKRVFV